MREISLARHEKTVSSGNFQTGLSVLSCGQATSTNDTEVQDLCLIVIVKRGLTLPAVTERMPFRENRSTLMKAIDKRDNTNETRIAPKPVRAGDKVARDNATRGEGKVYLGTPRRYSTTRLKTGSMGAARPPWIRKSPPSVSPEPIMSSSASSGAPVIEFFQLVSTPRPPRRADRSAGGSIPVRALRYCEAMTTASAFGWYVFVPITFKVVWDGDGLLWTYEGIDEWLPLTRETAQYPHFDERFDAIAPPNVRGFAPPFLTASFQPGGLQVWTGCLVRTAPGWNLLVRGAANFPKSLSYQVFEGIIETDTWFGPLFDNIKISQDGHAGRVSQRRSTLAGSASPQRGLLRQVLAQLRGQGCRGSRRRRLGCIPPHRRCAQYRGGSKAWPLCRVGAKGRACHGPSTRRLLVLSFCRFRWLPPPFEQRNHERPPHSAASR